MGNHMFDNTVWAGHWLWMLVVAIVVVIPVWRICQRTGYPGWLGILILIPIGNFCPLCSGIWGLAGKQNQKSKMTEHRHSHRLPIAEKNVCSYRGAIEYGS